MFSRFRKSTLILGSILTVLPCFGLTLKELETSYESKCSEIRLEKATALQSLRDSYLGALRRIEAKYQRAGRLDEVLFVKQESAAIEKGQWPLKALPNAISLETNAPRKIYLKKHIEIEQQAAKDLASTADTMEKALDLQIADLTRSGELAEAKLAQQIKAEIAKDPDITSARQLLQNVRSDGSARPALRIRRAGDNIEVLVHYDMRGKIGPESPISNVEESDKSIGDTEAKNLGEFAGVEGYDTIPRILLQEDYSDGEIGTVSFRSIEAEANFTVAEETGIKVSFPKNPKNPYAAVGAAYPPGVSSNSLRLTCRYYVPRSNKGIVGLQFTEGGGLFGGEKLLESGKWSEGVLSGTSGPESTHLLMYLSKAPSKTIAQCMQDYLVISSLKLEQTAFSAYLMNRFSPDGAILEEHKDFATQPIFVKNGQISLP